MHMNALTVLELGALAESLVHFMNFKMAVAFRSWLLTLPSARELARHSTRNAKTTLRLEIDQAI